MSGYDAYEPDWDGPPQGNRGRQTQGRGSGQRRGGKGSDLGNYTEVKDRIQQFYAKYPDGSLVTTKVKILTDIDPPRVMVQALAFRSPDDLLPGVGTSWLVIPGRTPYTNGSEVENAETSAWGRAIASLGIAVDKNIATSDEIRNKRDEGEESHEEAGGGGGGTQTAPPAPAGQESTTETLRDDPTATRVPRSLDGKTDAEINAMSLEVLLELARERFISSAIISKTARAMFGESVSLRALSNEDRQRLWNALVTGDISNPASTESQPTSEPSTSSS